MTLQEDLQKLGLQQSWDLRPQLDRVKDSAYRIWDQQRLLWFTDHTAQGHSERIISHLNGLLAHMQQSQARLTDHEIFVLLAAAYVHDIGMQDLRIADVDNFTPEDYVRVREQHPKISKELIVNRSLRRDRGQFRIDIDDGPYLVPTALVSKAHGTSYFEETIRELNVLPSAPGNEPFRGDLLAALLLIGDELDLHEERASFPGEMSRSPLANLHHYIHHYITRIEICEGLVPQVRQFHLTFNFPEEADYAAEIKEWVVAKLYRQSNLTKHIIEVRTQGELRWDDSIHVRTTFDSHGYRRDLPDECRSVLRAVLTDGRVVDREAVMDAVNSFVSSPNSGREVDLLERPGCDIEFLMSWVQEKCGAGGLRVVHVSLQERIGHSPEGVLDAIRDELEIGGLQCESYRQSQGGDKEARLQSLAVDLHQHTPLVVILEAVDRAEEETSEWLGALADMLVDAPVLVIRTREGDPEIGRTAFPLDLYTEHDITVKFRNEFGLDVEEATLEARAVYEMTEGIPLRVLNGLENYRSRRSVAP